MYTYESVENENEDLHIYRGIDHHLQVSLLLYKWEPRCSKYKVITEL